MNEDQNNQEPIMAFNSAEWNEPADSSVRDLETRLLDQESRLAALVARVSALEDHDSVESDVTDFPKTDVNIVQPMCPVEVDNYVMNGTYGRRIDKSMEWVLNEDWVLRLYNWANPGYKKKVLLPACDDGTEEDERTKFLVRKETDDGAILEYVNLRSPDYTYWIEIDQSSDGDDSPCSTTYVLKRKPCDGSDGDDDEETLGSWSVPNPPELSMGSISTGPTASASITQDSDCSYKLNLTLPSETPGCSPDFSIGTVTTGTPGSNAAVSITGTQCEPVLNFTIPRGNPGEDGCDPEVNATATATTLSSGSNATVQVARGGSKCNRTFAFTFGIPKGEPGQDGCDPSLSIGTVTTGTPGGAASASITGSDCNYSLNLTIPQGPYPSGSFTVVDDMKNEDGYIQYRTTPYTFVNGVATAGQSTWHNLLRVVACS